MGISGSAVRLKSDLPQSHGQVCLPPSLWVGRTASQEGLRAGHGLLLSSQLGLRSVGLLLRMQVGITLAGSFCG